VAAADIRVARVAAVPPPRLYLPSNTARTPMPCHGHTPSAASRHRLQDDSDGRGKTRKAPPPTHCYSAPADGKGNRQRSGMAAACAVKNSLSFNLWLTAGSAHYTTHHALAGFGRADSALLPLLYRRAHAAQHRRAAPHLSQHLDADGALPLQAPALTTSPAAPALQPLRSLLDLQLQNSAPPHSAGNSAYRRARA